MKEEIQLVFSGQGSKAICIEIRPGDNKLEVYVMENSMGYGQKSVTDAFAYIAENYPGYTLKSVRTKVHGVFNFTV